MATESDILSQFDADEAAYWSMREELLKEFKGKWVAVHNRKVVASGNNQSEVIKSAYEVLGKSPFYLNCVGEEDKVGKRVYRCLAALIIQLLHRSHG
ncbi:MAG: DUF5678 domain-containing protein [Euryarchaeota archaeon]|nr:DUF5678 domain-containing protein [Euryarchaeota archaeon]